MFEKTFNCICIIVQPSWVCILNYQEKEREVEREREEEEEEEEGVGVLGMVFLAGVIARRVKLT